MAISEGQTRVTLQLDGKGNAVAHMKQVEGGFAVLISKAQMLGEAGEKLASGLDRSFEKARKGTLTFRDGLDAALDVASAFGPVGKIVAGVGKSITAIVDGLWDLFDTKDEFSAWGQALADGIGPTLKLAGALMTLGQRAAEASGKMTAVRNSTLAAMAAVARSQGDEDKAKRLEAQAVANVSKDDLAVKKRELEAARQLVRDLDPSLITEAKIKIENLTAKLEEALADGDASAVAAITTQLEPLKAGFSIANEDARRAAIEHVIAKHAEVEALKAKLAEENLRGQPGFIEFGDDEAGAAMNEDRKKADKLSETASKKAEAERAKQQEDDRRKAEATRKRELALELELALERAVDDVQRMQLEREQWAADVRAGEMTEREFALQLSLQMLEVEQELTRQDEERLEKLRERNKLIQASNDNQLAEQLGEYSTTLQGVLPNSSALVASISELGSMWAEVLELQKQAEESRDPLDIERAKKAENRAIRESIAVGAEAAASFVKNESAKQAILAVTQLGLAFGAIGTGDFGAAAAHFTAASILGAKAFGADSAISRS